MKPFQYQKGWAEFYKLRFKVTPAVLIPRPETELLVDEVITQVKTSNHPNILDIGTGSGCIAISLAKNLPHAKIIATDISKKALGVARQNARFQKVNHQITFLQSDLLSHIECGSFDVIVTNLPYIPTARIPNLDTSVKDFEPILALDGGFDGFDLYRKLFQQIKEKGWKPKLIIGETDYTQGELALWEAQKCFPQKDVEVKKDLGKKQRILLIR